MSRIKKPPTESKIEMKDQPTIPTNLPDISVNSETIEETQTESLPTVVIEGDGADGEGKVSQDQSANTNQIETTAEDCEVLYGVILETAHGVVGKKKGKGHRGLPESRRKAQGKLLHSICQKYNIVIPTEFELVIFGGALIADWQYMTVDEDKNESESTTVESEGETEQ